MVGMRKRSEVVEDFVVPKDAPIPSGVGSLVHNPHAATEVPLSPGFDRVVEKVFIRDPEKIHSEYVRLERELHIGVDHGTYTALMAAMDRAETNVRSANRLHISSQLERDRWEMDNEVYWAGMREEATAILHNEKVSGARSKQITDADVAAKIAKEYPDQYRAQEIQRTSVKRMVDSLKNLEEAWMMRCRTLQAMLNKQR
jgi:hypothetical protein